MSDRSRTPVSGAGPARGASWAMVPGGGDAHGGLGGVGGVYGCGDHDAGPGRLDESARRLSHEELTVASLLSREGHDVRSLAETRGGGRQADLSVCGSPVEIKSFAPLSERRREPGARSVFNKLADAAGQAPHVVLLAAGSGLTPASVRQGLASYLTATGPSATLHSVRAVGEGFDLTWARGPGFQVTRGGDRSLAAVPGARKAARELGKGLGL